MTGSQSLSAAQWASVSAEIARVNAACDPARAVKFDDEWHTVGTVVTVVVHQSLANGDGRKRVQLHCLYGGSHAFGVTREGAIIDSAQAA